MGEQNDHHCGEASRDWIAEQAGRYFDFLGRAAGEITEVRTISPDGGIESVWLDDREGFIETCTTLADITNIYAGVLPRRETERGDEAVASAGIVFVDIDPPGGANPEEAARLVEEGARAIVAWSDKHGRPKPMIICSGRGRHFYWRVPAVQIAGGNRRRIKTARRALLRHLRDAVCDLVDPTVFNFERLARVPGSKNFKLDPPTYAEILEPGDPTPSQELLELMTDLGEKYPGAPAGTDPGADHEDSGADDEIDLSFLADWLPDEGRAETLLAEHPKLAEKYSTTPDERKAAGGDGSRSGMLYYVIRACVTAELPVCDIWQVVWQHPHNRLGEWWEGDQQDKARHQFCRALRGARKSHEEWTATHATAVATTSTTKIIETRPKTLEALGGGYGEWRGKEKDKKQWVAASNATAEFTEIITVREGDETTIEYRGTTSVQNGPPLPLSMTADELFNRHRFLVAWGRCAKRLEVEESALGMIRNTILAHSDPAERLILREVGPVPPHGYIAPGFSIKGGEFIEHQEISVELPEGCKEASLLGLVRITDEQVISVGAHIVAELIPLAGDELMLPLLAHAFVAPFHHEPEIVERYNPAALILHGPSGCGKSTAAQLALCFFGRFASSLAMVSWGSTSNYIQKAGWYFNGAIFVADDLKRGTVGEAGMRQAMRIIQSAADGHGRGRLTRTSGFNSTYEIRGLLVVTGEDLPVGETSVLARCILVECPAKGDKDADKYSRCIEASKKFSGLMAAYIAWGQRHWPASRIRETMDAAYRTIHKRLAGAAAANTERVAQNFALNRAGMLLLISFLRHLGVLDDKGCAGLLTRYLAVMNEHLRKTVLLIGAQRPADLFISRLRELVASGRVSIAPRPNKRKSKSLAAPVRPPNMAGFHTKDS